jgi:hypothetical protein
MAISRIPCSLPAAMTAAYRMSASRCASRKKTSKFFSELKPVRVTTTEHLDTARHGLSEQSLAESRHERMLTFSRPCAIVIKTRKQVIRRGPGVKSRKQQQHE